MAKNGTWIKLLTVVGIALLGFAVGYGMLKGKVSANTVKIEEVKNEGCIPAREAKTNIAVMQKDIEHIKGAVDRIEGAVIKDKGGNQ